MNSKTITELGEIEMLAAAVRDEIFQLDRSEKTKNHYINSGLDAVLSYFHHNNCHDFSKRLLDEMVSERYNDFIHGNAGRFKYCIVRKTATWLCEFRETGKISPDKLNAYGFKYMSDEYETLISEYISHSLKMGLLKESSIKAYSGLVRRFFRIIESKCILAYKSLTLPDISTSVVEYGAKNSRSTGAFLDALRSFCKIYFRIAPGAS